jgi:glycosyltransferase involved in cell wall biosynthesis
MKKGANGAAERPRKILSVVDKMFEKDIRVKTEAFVLAAAGYHVRVLALSPWVRASRTIVEHGVVLYTFPMLNLFKKSTRSRSRFGVLLYHAYSAIGYFVEYFNYIVATLFLVAYIGIRDGFDAIHFNNPPAALCIILSAFKLFGKKLVFDHHDLEPELYLSRYRVEPNAIYKILLALESTAIRVADMVIATNESYKAIEIERGRVSAEKIFVVRNAPGVRGRRHEDTAPAARADGLVSLVYLGIMGPQDGVDYLLRALAHLRTALGKENFRCTIIGEGDALEDLRALARELSLDDVVEFTGFVPNEERDRRLASADICLDPNPSSPLNDHSTWIKVMEYMAYAKPIVSFDLKETRFTAGEAAQYVKPNDVEEYALAIASLMDDPARRLLMGERGHARVTTELTWERSGENLIRAYRWLFSQPGGRFLRSFYYVVKPLLPRRVQIMIRRRLAGSKLSRVHDIWPIDPRSARKPDGWQGWPEGKSFALVLTHDVEHLRGVRRVRRLANLENEMGFVSAFNFVPERYPIEEGLREELVARGFEVGVHDLNHDGKLYNSRRLFSRRAVRINGYLRQWGASGFRSAAMRHNLEWLKDLDVEYDCSTFDTDPFEPQSDGIGTIFPVWVPDESRGYIELPYTLPQDMTLFVLLREESPRIWLEKLQWVAEMGGMALLDTHPDYMSCPGEKLKVDEYPCVLYREFLETVKQRYAGHYWPALPQDVARWWRAMVLPARKARAR